MARNSSAAAWLNAAGRQTMLADAEALELGRLVRAWQDHPAGPTGAPPRTIRRGLRARNRLTNGNLRLVSMVAGRVRRPPYVALEDALQAGAVGLVRAAEMFDPARGYKFSTYAYLWIKQSITNEIDKSGTIRVPANVCAVMRGQRYGTPSRQQLEAGILAWRCISLDASAPGATDDSGPLADAIVGGRLGVEQLGTAEEVADAFTAMAEADADGLALLQLRYGDGALVGDLAQLEGASLPATTKRLRATAGRLRALPAVQVALVG